MQIARVMLFAEFVQKFIGGAEAHEGGLVLPQHVPHAVAVQRRDAVRERGAREDDEREQAQAARVTPHDVRQQDAPQPMQSSVW